MSNQYEKFDIYDFRHHAAHLQEAGLSDDLHELLAEETDDQLNAWYEAQIQWGEIGAYLDDVYRAWQVGGTALDPVSPSGNLVLQCRYALIIASVNSLTHNIGPELLEELVKRQIWTTKQGLFYANQMPDVELQRKALNRLIPYLSPEQQQEILHATQNIEDNYKKAEALVNLAAHFRGVEQGEILYEALQTTLGIENSYRRAEVQANLATIASNLSFNEKELIINEALRTAQGYDDNYDRAVALAYLAPHLSAEHLQETLCTAQNIKDSDLRVHVLALLAPTLSADKREEVIADALRSTQNINRWFAQDKALAEPAPYFSVQNLHKVLEIARSHDDPYSRALALTHLAPQLSAQGQENILHEALDDAQNVEDDISRFFILTNLAPYLSGNEKDKVIYDVLNIAQSTVHSLSPYAEALANLAAHLSTEQLQAALDVAENVEEISNREHVLNAIALHLSVKQLQEALHITQTIKDDYARAEFLTNFSFYLSDNEKKEALLEALHSIQNMNDISRKADALLSMVPQLSAGGLEEVLGIAQGIQHRYHRARVLTNIATRLLSSEKEDVIKEALRIAQSIGNSGFREMALADLIPLLPPEVALDISKTIDSGSLRIESLTKLASYISDEQREKVLPETFSIIQTIEPISFDVQAFLAIYLSDEQREKVLQEALDITQTIEHNPFGVQALSNLAIYLSTDKREKVLQEALDIAQSIKGDYERTEALTGLLPYLPLEKQQDILQKVLVSAQSIKSSISQVEALVNLIPHLSAKQLEEVLHIAQRINSIYLRAQVLTNLASKLPADKQKAVLQEVLLTAKSIEDGTERVKVLSRVAPQLTQLSFKDAYSFWNNTLRSLSSHTRSELLADMGALTLFIAHIVDTDDAPQIVRTIRDIGRWWP